MKKRILPMLLSLSLCLTMIPSTAMAAENGEQENNSVVSEQTSVDTWDGTADTSWYIGNEDKTEYHISTAEQLAGLAKLVNTDPGKTNFKGKTFYLDNDLDLSGHEWISIGTGRGGTQAAYGFCGIFDGQRHVISNLYSHDSYVNGYDENNNLRNALFGNVYEGEIKNLGVENAEIWIDSSDDSAAGKGILVDWLFKSKITNCWTSGSVEGGLKIEKNIGGIVGVALRGCTISGCYSTATLTGNYTNSEDYYDNDTDACDTLGGIVGARFDGAITINDCWFGGKIIVNSIQGAAAGIIGYADAQTTIKNCMVATDDIGTDKSGEVNSCWVGYIWDGTVENNYWVNDNKYAATPLEDVDAGTAVDDFTSDDILSGLQENAESGINWVAGIEHPTFDWDSRNISADYTAVEKAVAEAEKLNPDDYEDFSAVEEAVNAVDYKKTLAEQSKVDKMAEDINDAIAGLKKLYLITVNDGTADFEKATEGKTVTITAKVPDGKAFEKWIVNTSNVTLADENSEKTTFTMVGGNVEITASLKTTVTTSAAFTIIFDSNGGTETESQTVNEGDTVTKPVNPTKEGYTFKGWFKDEALTEEYDFSTPVTDDITLYAAWEKNKSDSKEDTSDPSYAGGNSSSGGGSSSSSSKNEVTVDKKTENGIVKIDKDTASKGSTVTITVTPDEGYEVDEIKVTDESGNEIKVTDKGNGKYTFTMPATDVDIKADFKKITSDSDKEPTVITMQIGNTNVSVNEKVFTNDVAPIIRNNRTLVPIRVVTETLGGKVDWNDATKEVTLNIDGKEIKMTIGVILEKYGVAPEIINDRTYVPIRFVAEELGADVQWNEETKTVTITKL